MSPNIASELQGMEDKIFPQKLVHSAHHLQPQTHCFLGGCTSRSISKHSENQVKVTHPFIEKKQ